MHFVLQYTEYHKYVKNSYSLYAHFFINVFFSKQRVKFAIVAQCTISTADVTLELAGFYVPNEIAYSSFSSVISAFPECEPMVGYNTMFRHRYSRKRFSPVFAMTLKNNHAPPPPPPNQCCSNILDTIVHQIRILTATQHCIRAVRS